MLVAMDLVWIVLLAVAFWKLVGRPVAQWLESVVGVRFLGRRSDDA